MLSQANCGTPHPNHVNASAVVAASKQRNIYELWVWACTSVGVSTRVWFNKVGRP